MRRFWLDVNYSAYFFFRFPLQQNLYLSKIFQCWFSSSCGKSSSLNCKITLFAAAVVSKKKTSRHLYAFFSTELFNEVSGICQCKRSTAFNAKGNEGAVSDGRYITELHCHHGQRKPFNGIPLTLGEPQLLSSDFLSQERLPQAKKIAIFELSCVCSINSRRLGYL